MLERPRTGVSDLHTGSHHLSLFIFVVCCAIHRTIVLPPSFLSPLLHSLSLFSYALYAYSNPGNKKILKVAVQFVCFGHQVSGIMFSYLPAKGLCAGLARGKNKRQQGDHHTLREFRINNYNTPTTLRKINT